jgi:hypothetical protein
VPFLLVVIGLLMVATGYHGTYRQFGSLVAGEFQGKNNFLYFAAAIGAVGAIGYIDQLRTFSRLLLALVLIGIVVSNKGFFANLQSALAAGPKQPAPAPAQQSLSSSSSTSDIGSAILGNQSGLTNPLPGGSTNAPTSSGQAKFNGWMNYLLGTGTNSNGAQ